MSPEEALDQLERQVQTHCRQDDEGKCYICLANREALEILYELIMHR